MSRVMGEFTLRRGFWMRVEVDACWDGWGAYE